MPHFLSAKLLRIIDSEAVTSECPSFRNLMKPQGGSWEDPRGGGPWRGYALHLQAAPGGLIAGGFHLCVLLPGFVLSPVEAVFERRPSPSEYRRFRMFACVFSGPARPHPSQRLQARCGSRTSRFIPAVVCRRERFSQQRARRRSEEKTLPLRPPL